MNAKDRLEGLLPKLAAKFPRRKFKLIEGEKPYIEVVGAYTTITSEASLAYFCARLDNRIHLSFTERKLDKVEAIFAHETALRDSQRKQRSEMRKMIPRLHDCDMFAAGGFSFNIRGFTSNSRDIPTIEIAYTCLPHAPVGTIEYVCYSDVFAQSRYRVYFGNILFEVDSPKEILNIFDSGEVFKKLDGQTNPLDIQTSRDESGFCVGIIEWSESHFLKQAPYLMIMEAYDLELKEVMTNVTIAPPSTTEDSEFTLLSNMFEKQVPHKYLKFKCHPELKWERIYANSAPEE